MATQITQLPIPPSRQDPLNFSQRGDAFLGALPQFQQEANALAVFVEQQANMAEQQVVLAQQQVSLAEDQVQFATDYASNANSSAVVATAAANYKGVYSDSTYYLQGESVSYNGSRYIANSNVNGVTPAGSPQWLAIRGSEIATETRTSNTEISYFDFGKLFLLEGTFTQSVASAIDLGAGWWCYLKNNSDGDITLQSSDQIDSRTFFVMYPKEVRMLYSDGTSIKTIVLNSFYKKFEASGTFVKPPGYSMFEGLLWAGGGSGGKASSTAQAGGGGGGACVVIKIRPDFVLDTEAVVIGAGGAANSVNNSRGNAGGNSSFSGIFSYGGGGGYGTSNATATSSGGGGGGALSAGGGGTIGIAYGGMPAVSSGGIISGGYPNHGAGGGSSDASSYLGGGGGGSIANNASSGNPGGASVYGGGGGGSSGSSSSGSGGISVFGGAGGNGGTPTTAATDGAIPGGGGGGTEHSTASGAGARGELRIWGVI